MRSSVVDGVDEPGPAAAATPGNADLSCITRCCPGLHRISIDVQAGAQLAELAKVSGLTCLWVSGLYAEGFASLRALSGLVSLQELSVYLNGPITPQDLLCLTALTRLTRLLVDPEQAPMFEGADHAELELYQVCTYLCFALLEQLVMHGCRSSNGGGSQFVLL